ncbi:MAG: hypothetical protein EBR82_80315 [Caulobacteraceae bacterium]|nr:hypothetical protein [Caulobacteraceae bacterium]
MKLVNLTPHAVVLHRADGTTETVQPSGTVARVTQETTRVGSVAGVPVVTTRPGPVTGLPDFEADDGAGYIVSTLVRLALPERIDLFSPADLVRDAGGNVVGCRSLEGNPTEEEATR